MGVTTTESPRFGSPITSDCAYSICSEDGGGGCGWFYRPAVYPTSYSLIDIGTFLYFGAAEVNGRVGRCEEPGDFTESWWANLPCVGSADFQDVLAGTSRFLGFTNCGNLSDQEQGLLYSLSEDALVGGTQTDVVDHHPKGCVLGTGSWSETGYFCTPVETMCFEAGNTGQLRSSMKVDDPTGVLGEVAGATSDMGTGSYFAEPIKRDRGTSGNRST